MGDPGYLLATHYGGRCSECQHGPTNPLLRSEHDPQQKRRMMQAREYGWIIAPAMMGLWMMLGC